MSLWKAEQVLRKIAYKSVERKDKEKLIADLQDSWRVIAILVLRNGGTVRIPKNELRSDYELSGKQDDATNTYVITAKPYVDSSQSEEGRE